MLLPPKCIPLASTTRGNQIKRPHDTARKFENTHTTTLIASMHSHSRNISSNSEQQRKRMTAILQPIGCLARSEHLLPILGNRHRILCGKSPERTAILCPHQLNHLPGRRHKCLLEPNNHDAVPTVAHHRFHLRSECSGRLLHPHMQPGIQRLARQFWMCFRRHTDKHAIQILTRVHIRSAGIASTHAVFLRRRLREIQPQIAKSLKPHRKIMHRRQDIPVTM